MDDKVKEHKSFPAKLQNLYSILVWIKERISKFLTQKELEKMELACEEVIVNVIKHGYKKKIGSINIEIIVNKTVTINFKDKGSPFNPIAKKKKIDTKAPLNKRKAGGLGILLIYKCVDEVLYERKASYNILSLVKKRSQNY